MMNFIQCNASVKQYSLMLMAVASISLFGSTVTASADMKGEGPVGVTAKVEKKTSDYKMQKAYPKGKHSVRFPPQELNRGQEGWVVISYIVDVDGRVKDPIVLDSAGSDRFASVAKKALRNYHFYPALLNGKPTETADNKYKFMFSIKKRKAGASKNFIRGYRQVRKYLDNGELDMFLEKISVLKEKRTNNHYENSFYWFLMAGYYSEIKDPVSYLSSLKRAIGFEGEYLPRKMHASALSSVYYQRLIAGDIKGALETATRIESYLKNRPELKSVLVHRDELLEKLKTHPIVTTSGVIGEERYWVHDLLRRNVSLNVQGGDINGIEFRCEKQVRRFEFDQDGPKSMWKIPTKWGDCSVFVKGTIGAEFMLLESL